MSPHVKLSALLALIMVLPSMCATAMLDMAKPQAALALLALHTALGVGLLPFIARGILHVVIFRDLRELSDFSARLRRGEEPRLGRARAP